MSVQYEKLHLFRYTGKKEKVTEVERKWGEREGEERGRKTGGKEREEEEGRAVWHQQLARALAPPSYRLTLLSTGLSAPGTG